MQAKLDRAIAELDRYKHSQDEGSDRWQEIQERLDRGERERQQILEFVRALSPAQASPADAPEAAELETAASEAAIVATPQLEAEIAYERAVRTAELRGHEESVLSVAVHPNGKHRSERQL